LLFLEKTLRSREETKVIDFMGLLKKSLQEKKKKSAFHVKPSAKKHAIRKKQ
jgi:non-homologous end joining protein Ku